MRCLEWSGTALRTCTRFLRAYRLQSFLRGVPGTVWDARNTEGSLKLGLGYFDLAFIVKDSTKVNVRPGHDHGILTSSVFPAGQAAENLLGARRIMIQQCD